MFLTELACPLVDKFPLAEGIDDLVERKDIGCGVSVQQHDVGVHTGNDLSGPGGRTELLCGCSRQHRQDVTEIETGTGQQVVFVLRRIVCDIAYVGPEQQDRTQLGIDRAA